MNPEPGHQDEYVLLPVAPGHPIIAPSPTPSLPDFHADFYVDPSEFTFNNDFEDSEHIHRILYQAHPYHSYSSLITSLRSLFELYDSGQWPTQAMFNLDPTQVLGILRRILSNLFAFHEVGHHLTGTVQALCSEICGSLDSSVTVISLGMQERCASASKDIKTQVDYIYGSLRLSFATLDRRRAAAQRTVRVLQGVSAFCTLVLFIFKILGSFKKEGRFKKEIEMLSNIGTWTSQFFGAISIAGLQKVSNWMDSVHDAIVGFYEECFIYLSAWANMSHLLEAYQDGTPTSPIPLAKQFIESFKLGFLDDHHLFIDYTREIRRHAIYGTLQELYRTGTLSPPGFVVPYDHVQPDALTQGARPPLLSDNASESTTNREERHRAISTRGASTGVRGHSGDGLDNRGHRSSSVAQMERFSPQPVPPTSTASVGAGDARVAAASSAHSPPQLSRIRTLSKHDSTTSVAPAGTLFCESPKRD